MSALAQDLGYGFGASLGGGIGGDVEVFAVSGCHVTPWHFDAQDNFTVQLSGTKRWTVAASGITHPLANCHPATAALAALASDLKVTRSHSPSAALPPTPEALAAGGTSFVLRPGSTMYLPAGTWHRVEAQDEAGSLSVNFSMAPARWVDLIAARLAPALWALPEWRAPIVCSQSPAATRAGLARMLPAASAAIAKVLDPRVLLPDGLFDDARLVTLPDRGRRAECTCGVGSVAASSGEVNLGKRSGDVAAGARQAMAAPPSPQTLISRSPGSTLLFPVPQVAGPPSHLPSCSVARVRAAVAAGFGLGGSTGSMTSDFEVVLDVPARLGSLLAAAVALQAGEATTVEALVAPLQASSQAAGVSGSSASASAAACESSPRDSTMAGKRRRDDFVGPPCQTLTLDDACALLSVLVFNGYLLVVEPPAS